MPKKQEQKKEPALRGTFASVMLLGAFIVVTWAAVFVLFLVRQ
ncbi:cytochrome c oxidase subunit 2A [Paenibacillus sp. TAB 01]